MQLVLDSEATIEYAHKYEQLGQYALASTFETDEVLYGRAGYLLDGLMLNQQAGKELVSLQLLNSVLDCMMERGRVGTRNTTIDERAELATAPLM